MFDGGGLYLEISPSGGKWWRFKYRFAGKEKRISLGVYPEVSLKEARSRRDEQRRLLASDIDPSVHRKAHKAKIQFNSSNTFESVAREWFSKQEPNWAHSHSIKIIQRLERDIFPWIGSKAVDTLCPSSNKWNRRSDYLMESFAHHFHITRRVVGSANDVSQ